MMLEMAARLDETFCEKFLGTGLNLFASSFATNLGDSLGTLSLNISVTMIVAVPCMLDIIKVYG